MPADENELNAKFEELVVSCCMMGNFACFLLSSADFFSKSSFLKNSFRNTIRVSNSLNPDQARRNVGPDLGSKLLAKVIIRQH